MNNIVSQRYRIIEVIGTGGMAVVYRAWDDLKNREVALKVLRPEYEEDREFVRRFNHEAMAAAKMSHENIVNMYDVGIDGDMRYIVMEYVNGQTLKELIRSEGHIRPQQAVRIALRILAAVDHAHKNHIIHRDIKPQNILVDQNGTIKVADFGIARLVNASTMTISDTNTALGSVHYVSPEQASGEHVDEKSDLYSVGVVLYEMLTGSVPFDGETPVAVALKQVQEEPRSMRELRNDISIALDEVVMKALAKDTAKRYQSAAEMAGDLKRALKMPSGGFVKYDPEGDEEERVSHTFGGYLRQHGVTALLVGIACLTVISIVSIVALQVSNVIYGVDVPSIVGYSSSIAEQMLSGYELKCEIDYAYSLSVEAGYVIEQSPQSGETVRRGATVTITVSEGAEPITLPDTTGLSVSAALSLLSNYGFTQVEITYDVNRELETDIVLSQQPLSGMVKPDSIVRLSVNSREIAVPQLAGSTIAGAEATLIAQGLKLGEISYAYSLDAAADTIIAQTVPSGTMVFKDTSVGITVALAYPTTYYADYTLHIPLTMNVRIVQIAPSGIEKEAANENAEEGSFLSFNFSSNEEGPHVIQVYYDNVLSITETLDFR